MAMHLDLGMCWRTPGGQNLTGMGLPIGPIAFLHFFSRNLNGEDTAWSLFLKNSLLALACEIC